MRKSLLYILIMFCVSLIAAQIKDHISPTETDSIEIIQENFKENECLISEYTHKQCATRPSNVQVPSITRTHSAHRSNNVNSPTSCAVKSDFKSSNISGAPDMLLDLKSDFTAHDVGEFTLLLLCAECVLVILGTCTFEGRVAHCLWVYSLIKHSFSLKFS